MQSRLNLATRTYINRQALYLFYAVCTALLILILIAQVRYLLQLQEQETLLEERMAEVRADLGLANEGTAGYTDAELERLQGEIAFSNDLIIKDSFRWTALLGQLEKVLPAEVKMTDLRPDFRDSTLNITALAQSVSDMRRFLDRLIQSDAFSDVLLLSQAEQKVGRDAVPLIMFSLQVKGELR